MRRAISSFSEPGRQKFGHCTMGSSRLTFRLMLARGGSRNSTRDRGSSLAPTGGLDDLPRGERAGSTIEPGSRMSAGAAQEEIFNGRHVAGPTENRACGPQVIQPQFAVKDVATSQAVGAFKIEWRNNLPRNDRPVETGSVSLDGLRGDIRKMLALGVPCRVSQAGRRKLNVSGNHMLISRREASIQNRRDRQFDPRFVCKAAVLCRVECALDGIDVGTYPHPAGECSIPVLLIQ